jgi:hypothetical protein
MRGDRRAGLIEAREGFRFLVGVTRFLWNGDVAAIRALLIETRRFDTAAHTEPIRAAPCQSMVS